MEFRKADKTQFTIILIHLQNQLQTTEKVPLQFTKTDKQFLKFPLLEPQVSSKDSILRSSFQELPTLLLTTKEKEIRVLTLLITCWMIQDQDLKLLLRMILMIFKGIWDLKMILKRIGSFILSFVMLFRKQREDWISMCTTFYMNLEWLGLIL